MAREILPHENTLLRNLIARGLAENQQAAHDMSQAASDTNSWHDNAEYDEVIDRMKLIDARYTPVAKLLGEVTIGQYPQESDKVVKLGSLVGVEFGKDDNVKVLLVGQAREGVDIYQKRWKDEKKDEELMVTSADSPLGQALDGKLPGENAEFEVNGRKNKVTILDIDQTWIVHFSADTGL